jgi:hypothetical protein
VLVKIAPHEHTSPLQLVQAAVSQKSHDSREARRGRGDTFDQYWCVFDVDEHPGIPEALDLARANDIRIAVSNPCIELWFLIHFENQTAYLSRREAQHKSKQYLKCGKSLTHDALKLLDMNYNSAKERAVKLQGKHKGDDSPKHENPSSNTWRLIEAIVQGNTDGT